MKAAKAALGRKARDERHRLKKQARAQKKAARKATRQGERAAVKREKVQAKARRIEAPKVASRLQMQRDQRQHIQTLREEKRTLEKRIVQLQTLLSQAVSSRAQTTPQLAASI